MSNFKKRRGPGLDLDEIAPNRFLVHDVRATALLKGEGVFSGRLFELTSWRREGLLARLRERGFRVRTLDDRLDTLPEPPQPPPIGRAGWRPLVSPIEQISHFDLRNLRWHPLEPTAREGVLGVTLYDGWVLRRRKGRGAASYYLAFMDRGGEIGLRPLDETKAMLTGYAQALALDDRPLLVEQRGDRLVLPDIELPPPHRDLIDRMAEQTDAGLLVDQAGWPVAREVFLRLGIRLTIDRASTKEERPRAKGERG